MRARCGNAEGEPDVAAAKASPGAPGLCSARVAAALPAERWSARTFGTVRGTAAALAAANAGMALAT